MNFWKLEAALECVIPRFSLLSSPEPVNKLPYGFDKRSMVNWSTFNRVFLNFVDMRQYTIKLEALFPRTNMSIKSPREL